MRFKHSTGLPVNASGLPLFVWADSQPAEVELLEELPPAARRIARRFGVPPRRARIIAELAGYPVENNHA